MSETNPFQVAPGQVWMDNDSRVSHSIYQGSRRYLEVVSVDGTHAAVRSFHTARTAGSTKTHRVYGRTTSIRLNRFHPNSTGYKRVS